jgi:ribosomal protein L28
MTNLFESDLSWLQVQEAAPAARPRSNGTQIGGVRVGGIGLSPEHVAAIRQANQSLEKRQRIRQALLGRTRDPEIGRRIGQKQKGKTISAETRKKISENSASATAIMTPNGLFPTLRVCAKQIAQDLGIPYAYAYKKLWLWRRQYPEHYYTLKD